MREALARSDNDFLVAEPRRRKSAAPKSPPNRLIGAIRLLLSVANYPNRVAGAVLVAMAVAITVNALELQTSRHPAPLFGHAAPLAPAAPVVAAPAPAAPIAAPAPEAKPAPAPAVTAAPVVPTSAANADPLGQFINQDEAPAATHIKHPSHPAVPHTDPISQILRSNDQASDAPPKPSRTVAGVQRALVKLGFVLQPDGIEGDATRKALVQFEHDHHLPARGDLSPKVIRVLRAESDIAIP